MLAFLESLFDRLADDDHVNDLAALVASFDDEPDDEPTNEQECVRVVRDPRKPRPESEPDEMDRLNDLSAYDWPEWTDESVWMLWSEPEYVPTAQDWVDLDAYLSEVDRREYDEAMAMADIAETEHERRRFHEVELRHSGLPIG